VRDTSGREDDLQLSGRSVVLTRSAEQSPSLAVPLERLGAEVRSLPVIGIADPDDWASADAAIDRMDGYDWIVLTSVNGVDRLDARMRVHGRGLGGLAGSKVAVVGSATADRLRELGVEPAVVPAHFHAEGLVAALRAAGLRAGARVLVARAAEAREVLPEELRALGAVVDVAPVYRLVTVAPDPEVLARVAGGGVDAIVFASGGTARRFLEVVDDAGYDRADMFARAAVVSIGPVTTEALRRLGVRVDAEATSSTSEALVDAVVGLLSGGSR